MHRLTSLTITKKIVPLLCLAYGTSVYANEAGERYFSQHDSPPSINAPQLHQHEVALPVMSASVAPTALVAYQADGNTRPLTPISAPEMGTEGIASDSGGNSAITAAVADGVTTGLALSAGAIETNPLIATSPVGLLAITGAKIGIVKYAGSLPLEEKRTVMKTSTALWGGAAVNNLMVLAAAPTPLSIVAGLAAGFIFWSRMEEQYRNEDVVLASLAEKQAKADRISTELQPPQSVAAVSESSGN